MQGSHNFMASNSFWRGLVMFQHEHFVFNFCKPVYLSIFCSQVFINFLEDSLNLFGIDRELHCHSSGLATVNMQLCIECIAWPPSPRFECWLKQWISLSVCQQLLLVWIFTLGHQDTQSWVEVREATVASVLCGLNHPGVTNVEASLILSALDHF